MPESKIRVIDCFVYRERNERHIEFLLLHRSSDKLYKGMWRMVGGKIEENETAWQTAIRELQEELGIQIEQLWSVPFVNQFYEWQYDRINHIPVFLARITTDESIILNGEHDAFEWMNIDEAMAKVAFPGQREGLRVAYDLITEKKGLKKVMEIKLTEYPASESNKMTKLEA